MQVPGHMASTPAVSASGLSRDSHALNNLRVTFAEPAACPLHQHHYHHSALSPEEGLPKGHVFDSAVMNFLAEAQGSSVGLRVTEYQAPSDDSWQGFSIKSELETPNLSSRDLEFLDPASLGVSLGSLASWLVRPTLTPCTARHPNKAFGPLHWLQRSPADPSQSCGSYASSCWLLCIHTWVHCLATSARSVTSASGSCP